MKKILTQSVFALFIGLILALNGLAQTGSGSANFFGQDRKPPEKRKEKEKDKEDGDRDENEDRNRNLKRDLKKDDKPRDGRKRP